MRMKKRLLLGAAAAAALAVLWFAAWMRVDGGEISGVRQMEEASLVTAVRYRLGEEDRLPPAVPLSTGQVKQLRELLLGSSFTRILSGSVRFHDKEMTDLWVEFPDSREPLRIHCIGGEYLSITNQFGGKALRISEPQWKSRLNAILGEDVPSS